MNVIEGMDENICTPTFLIDHHKTTFDSDVALQRRDEEENNDDVLRHVAEGHCPVVQVINAAVLNNFFL